MSGGAATVRLGSDGCSTNWGAYLTSLKSGAERGQFAAYPAGEMSRWS